MNNLAVQSSDVQTQAAVVTKLLAELQSYRAADHAYEVIQVTDRAEAPHSFTWAYSQGASWKSVYQGVVISVDPGTTLELDFVAQSFKAGQPLATTTLAALGTFTRASPGTYWQAGLLKVAAANVPRYDSGGLIIERARTNLHGYSSNPGAWGITPAQGSANAAVGLDGTQSAFVPTAGTTVTAQHNIGIPVDDLPYALQIFIKTQASGKVYLPSLGLYDKVVNAGDDSAYYDLASNSFGPGMLAGWKAEVGGLFGPWTRLSIILRNSQSSSTFVARWKPDPTVQIIWGGIMFEQSALLTSFIPAPTGAAASQAAEALSISDASSWHPAAGALSVDADETVVATLGVSGIDIQGIGRLRNLAFTVGDPVAQPAALQLIGINIAGAEFGSNMPGVFNTDYFWPDAAGFARYQSYGINLVRLPFRWERLQPTLNAALDSAELARLLGALANAAAAGMYVILDMHNYFERVIGTTAYPIGSSQAPVAAWIDGWSRLVQVTQGNPGLYGYGLMNEPRGTAGLPLAQHWAPAAQLCVDAIRAIDADTTIFVAGDGYSSAGAWLENNQGLPLSGHNLIYEAHCYLDADSSGQYLNRSEAISPTIGVERLGRFVKWLKQYNVRGIVGEMGVPYDMPSAMTAMGNALSYLGNNDIPMFYWAGGAHWAAGQATAIELNGVVLGQMAVLDEHFKTVGRVGPQGL